MAAFGRQKTFGCWFKLRYLISLSHQTKVREKLHNIDILISFFKLNSDNLSTNESTVIYFNDRNNNG